MATTHRIYVDLDDVLGETARAFLEVLARDWRRQVDFEELTVFDLGLSLELERRDLERFLDAVHEPQVLAGIEPMPGALDALRRWRDAGHAITVVTGRPPDTRRASESWLGHHRFPYEALLSVDKYSRYYDGAHGTPDGALGLDQLAALGFTFAVEDFADTAAFLAAELDIPVALFDRPWNRDLSHLPADRRNRLVRCNDWAEVAAALPT